MQAHFNPLNLRGKKNVFCPYYNKCLDHACKNNWNYWTCLDCKHRCTSKAIATTLSSPQNGDIYYAISPSLFTKQREIESELL